jgi:hypothetical protein
MTYSKSEICKRANSLLKEGYTKSGAFTMAWAEAKAPADTAAKAIMYKAIQQQIEELEAQANAIKESIIADMDGAEDINAGIF